MNDIYIDSNVVHVNSDYRMLDLFITMKSTRSPQTARTYTSTLQRFLSQVDKPCREVTLSDVVSYQQSISHLAPTTQCKILTSIRSFFNFLSSQPGYLIANPMAAFENPKVEQNEQIEHILTRDEIERIRDVLRYRNPRNHLIVSFLFATGLRISELTNARWSDVFTDLHGNTGLRVVGKGRKVRVVKLTKRIFESLESYRQHTGLNDDDSPLFANRNGEALTPRYIEDMFAKVVKLARIGKPATIHWLRHSMASHSLHNGADVFKVQQQLGHSSLTVTQRYLHSLDKLNDAASDYVEMD